VAAQKRPDRSALIAELDVLEKEERHVSARRRQLHERLSVFPNEAAERQEREISARRREIHRKINELRAELNKQRG
jgi:hypothetical protein